MKSLNSHIEKYLDDYLAMTTNPEFAVFLKGKWGFGKSWFIRNYIAKREKDKFLFISLYGVISTKEIGERLFEQLHPFLASKKMKLASTIFRADISHT